MDFKQLEYFLAIAKTESVTAASEILHVSQPSLSASLHKLEKELGVSLFDHVGRHIVLNDRGRYLQQQALNMQRLMTETERSLKEDNTKRLSTVNCSLKLPMNNLGGVLGPFHTQFPDVTIRIGIPDNGIFRHETIDLELITSRIDLDGGNYIELGREPYVIALPPGHRLADDDEIDLADLRKDPFIMSVSGNYSSNTFKPGELCNTAGFEPTVVCEVQSAVEALSLVSSGLGCCLATSITWFLGGHPNVIAKPIKNMPLTRTIYAHLADDKPPTPATWAFVNYLQDFFEMHEHDIL